ncbi:DNA-binding CsgD family transcriptional regulator/tetratricopeptide (TPR) repeat protein [Saccharothrix ecbatanensis]|uniref:DNA-binding CsgD family transcriptional regulator/tetratricopeptide (TPR) repeat protein n=1 Tax=Saccharothrix ecbatanensis TaxID=1105145 RepID=A0A7W9HLS2_9PSEU|nr:helix-turn-helix transcriptional regulator [Saccharothrix ecbatanensis]MBB5804451.1 DNA-binding CsgD family transcriptional regulator/tetratricopeptide (TPR) repeat protein [Saccharothrix ecbatanensis]
MSKLHGRNREWASVLRFLSAPGGLLAIDAPPCCGKSLLLHEAVAAARDLGYTVVLACGEHFAASADVARALDRADSGTLIAVDQAHRDPAALLALLPRLRERRITALLTLTSAYAGPEVRNALAEHGCVLELGPVGDDVIGLMTTTLLGATPHPDLASLIATAGGDPHLAGELITGLREEGQLEVDGGVARLRGGWLPRRVSELVRGQVDALSAEAARLLRVAAVIGRAFSPREVVTRTGETEDALRPVADEVLASGLVVRIDERLEFVSDLVWRAVVESMPESVRHALRHDTAVLRAPDEDEPAGVPGTDAVHEVRKLAVNGRLGSAIALARESLAQDAPAGAVAELHVVLGGILLADGRPADAASEMEHAVNAEGAPEPLRRLAAAGRLLSLYFATGVPAGARAMTVLTAREREPSDADVVMAATVHSCLEWSDGNFAEAVYWGRESTRWEADRPTAWWQSQAAVSHAMKLSALGEFEQAERLVRESPEDDDEAVTAGAPTARKIARARVLTQAGQLAPAAAAADEGLCTARDRGLRILVPFASTVLATVALQRGEIAAAAEHVRRYRADLAAGEAVLHSGQYDWVELLLAHAEGGPDRVAELARGRIADAVVARRMLVDEPGAAPWLVRQASAVGDRDLAGDVVGAAERLAADNPGFAAVSVAAGHARALLEGDAAQLLAAAGRHRHPWARANANEDLAALLAEAGEADRAAAHTTRALRIFERMGADGEVARLRGWPDVNGATGVEWRRLSGPERDIARLVGAGMTNRQVARQLYLSPHTVNYHLRGIFKKLGISSRVELARWAHEQQTAETSTV